MKAMVIVSSNLPSTNSFSSYATSSQNGANAMPDPAASAWNRAAQHLASPMLPSHLIPVLGQDSKKLLSSIHRNTVSSLNASDRDAQRLSETVWPNHLMPVVGWDEELLYFVHTEESRKDAPHLPSPALPEDLIPVFNLDGKQRYSISRLAAPSPDAAGVISSVSPLNGSEAESETEPLLGQQPSNSEGPDPLEWSEKDRTRRAETASRWGGRFSTALAIIAAIAFCVLTVLTGGTFLAAAGAAITVAALVKLLAPPVGRLAGYVYATITIKSEKKQKAKQEAEQQQAVQQRQNGITDVAPSTPQNGIRGPAGDTPVGTVASAKGDLFERNASLLNTFTANNATKTQG